MTEIKELFDMILGIGFLLLLIIIHLAERRLLITDFLALFAFAALCIKYFRAIEKINKKHQK